MRNPAFGTYSGDFVLTSVTAAVCPLPTMNSAAHPSDTQTPLSSYPQVLPSRQADSPRDFARATPPEVSTAQTCRSPGFEAQATGARPTDCAMAGEGANQH